MTGGLLALAAAAAALVAGVISALVAALAPALDRVGERLAPASRPALWCAAAFAPLFFVGATLISVIALVPDHCVAHGAHHPHLCLDHAAARPGAAIAILAGAAAVRWLRALLSAARTAWRSRQVVGALEAASAGASEPRRVPGDHPWAATAGIARPRVFVSEALARDEDAELVIAHERAHARSRHALWRWLSSIALSLHLPGVGRPLARRLATAQEIAADRAAAAAVGDRSRVAAALVRLARDAARAPAGAIGFGAEHLEARVRSLLEDSESRAGLHPALCVATAAGVAALIAANAAWLHHGLETIFGYLS